VAKTRLRANPRPSFDNGVDQELGVGFRLARPDVDPATEGPGKPTHDQVSGSGHHGGAPPPAAGLCAGSVVRHPPAGWDQGPSGREPPGCRRTAAAVGGWEWYLMSLTGRREGK